MKGSRFFVGRMEDQADYGPRLREGLEWIEWQRIVAPQARVFIKPNLTAPRYRPGVTTSPELLKTLVSILLERTDRIAIGESDGGLGGFTAEEAFAGHGLYSLVSRGVNLINLSRQPRVLFREQVHRRLLRMELPRLLLEEVDVFIDVPVLKTHVITQISIGFKNLWGCLPDSRRLLHHAVLNEALPALARKLRPRICVADGFYAMDGPGPLFGEVIQLRALLVADGVGACDLAACRMMGIDPGKVPHLRRAREAGLLPTPDELAGKIPPAGWPGRKFRVRRGLSDWLALCFSKNRGLTWLVYLSPLRHLKNRLLRFRRSRGFQQPGSPCRLVGQ